MFRSRSSSPDAARAFPTALPVIPLTRSVIGRAGANPIRPMPPSVIESIETAVRLVRSGAAAAARHQSDRQACALRGRLPPSGPHGISRRPRGGTRRRQAGHPVMMLWSEQLAVVPVTVHIPLSRVPARADHRPDRPSPAASWRGNCASGSASPIRALPSPASIPMRGRTARWGGRRGRHRSGRRHPAGRGHRRSGSPAGGHHVPCPRPQPYDAALCHVSRSGADPDQDLAFDKAVNVTLGLPFVRTSPDHGTAFDIAGRALPRPDSLIAAHQARRPAWPAVGDA